MIADPANHFAGRYGVSPDYTRMARAVAPGGALWGEALTDGQRQPRASRASGGAVALALGRLALS